MAQLLVEGRNWEDEYANDLLIGHRWEDLLLDQALSRSHLDLDLSLFSFTCILIKPSGMRIGLIKPTEVNTEETIDEKYSPRLGCDLSREPPKEIRSYSYQVKSEQEFRDANTTFLLHRPFACNGPNAVITMYPSHQPINPPYPSPPQFSPPPHPHYSNKPAA